MKYENEVLKTIHERYSCRGYSAEMPTDAQLDAIARAAITAPSSMNRQCWRVIIVRDQSLLKEMEDEALKQLAKWQDAPVSERGERRSTAIFHGAPCLVVIPMKQEGRPAAELDCGIVAQTIALAASSLGLGNVICGLTALAFWGDKGAYFREKLQFPEGFEFGTSVVLGYPEKTKPPHEVDESKILYIG